MNKAERYWLKQDIFNMFEQALSGDYKYEELLRDEFQDAINRLFKEIENKEAVIEDLYVDLEYYQNILDYDEELI